MFNWLKCFFKKKAIIWQATTAELIAFSLEENYGIIGADVEMVPQQKALFYSFIRVNWSSVVAVMSVNTIMCDLDYYFRDNVVKQLATALLLKKKGKV